MERRYLEEIEKTGKSGKFSQEVGNKIAFFKVVVSINDIDNEATIYLIDHAGLVVAEYLATNFTCERVKLSKEHGGSYTGLVDDGIVKKAYFSALREIFPDHKAASIRYLENQISNSIDNKVEASI